MEGPIVRPTSSPSSRLFFSLPLELRNTVYRYIVISRLDCQSHPRLWRPLGVDGAISRIGYFDRYTVVPLLLTCHQIHDEAASVLYGENTFAFHISGLAAGPIFFFEWLAPRYIKLLRKVYIRTGYHVDTYAFRSEPMYGVPQHGIEPSLELVELKAARDLAISVALMKQAWPPKYKVFVNKHVTVSYPADEVTSLLARTNAYDWPASSYHLWKMFVTETETETWRIEFMRINWGSPCVKNLRADGFRETLL